MKKNVRLQQFAFPHCGNHRIGFYPLVDSFDWVKKLIAWGVDSIQLRMKNMPLENRIATYKLSIPYAQENKIRLFINDDWELAIEFNAYGVHLGQEDLKSADIDRIAKQGLRLGVSTHNEEDIHFARSLRPSYIACGPVYPTSSKLDVAPPIGIEKLQYYCQLISDYPVVAIGGINEDRLPDVLSAGVNGVSVIKVLLDANDPEKIAKKWSLRCGA